MGITASCPQCGGPVRAPDLMHTDWRCDACGSVSPLYAPDHISPEIMATAIARTSTTTSRTSTTTTRTGSASPAAAQRPAVPLWCPWPLPPGWTTTGVAWVGDDRTGVRATAVACSGPAPLSGGPADFVFVAEEPGVGLGTRYAGIPGPDPGVLLTDVMTRPMPGRGEQPPHAKIRVSGHPTPLWAVKSPTDRSAYAGEARGMWLYAIAWPASAGYLLLAEVVLHDLTEWLPPELVYGAPSPYLHGKV
ncbi:DUF6758 family protein [Micromonospora sp. NPDC003197]